MTTSHSSKPNFTYIYYTSKQTCITRVEFTKCMLLYLGMSKHHVKTAGMAVSSTSQRDVSGCFFFNISNEKQCTEISLYLFLCTSN